MANRLSTMSRFAEPDERDEPQVMAFCCQCNGELYEGQEAVKFDLEYFCERDCLEQYHQIDHVIIGEDI